MIDMVTSDVALRMRGIVSALLWLKLLILSVSTVFLLLSENVSRFVMSNCSDLDGKATESECMN